MTYIPNIPVPAQNSANNVLTTDVVGNKTDDQAGNSIASKTNVNDKHIHSNQRCYPTLANGVTLTGGVAAWALGAFVEIVPVNTIPEDYDIHYLNVAAYNANDVFEIVLYSGAVGFEVEIGRVRVTRITNVGASPHVSFKTPIIPANTRISGKVASQAGTSNTITISILYHHY